MRKRLQKKSEVLREGYVQGLKKAQSIIKKMINEELQIICNLDNYKPWSGAVATWDTIETAGKLAELEAILEDLYPEGISMVGLNDLLWHDSETVLGWLGLSEDDEDYE